MHFGPKLGKRSNFFKPFGLVPPPYLGPQNNIQGTPWLGYYWSERTNWTLIIQWLNSMIKAHCDLVHAESFTMLPRLISSSIQLSSWPIFLWCTKISHCYFCTDTNLAEEIFFFFLSDPCSNGGACSHQENQILT